MGKGFGDMSNLMRDAQKHAREAQRKMEELDASLKERVVEGTAGGGMVKAYVNGQQEIVAIKISREVVDPNDVEMLEDLVTAACAQGLKKAREMRQQEMDKLSLGFKLPGVL